MKFRDFLDTIKEILGEKISIELKSDNLNSDHYRVTPYSFIPKVGYKLTTDCYLDMGQGILECINDISAGKGHKIGFEKDKKQSRNRKYDR